MRPSRTTYVKPRPRRPRRERLRYDRIGAVVAALAVVVALVWFVSAKLFALAGPGGTLWVAQATHASPLPVPSATPLAWPTMQPARAWSPAERARLQAQLETIFAAPVFDHAGLVVLAQDGTPLFLRHERVPMTPASTLKLVVASTALERLGPDYRFTTSFASDAELDAAGELHGPLWLIGSGDPLLVSNDVRGGAGVLARAGVRRIDGGLRIDDSAFAGPELNPHWDPDDLEEGYAPPTSAVSLDEDTVEFHVAPTSPGAAALVTVEPPNARVSFSGTITTASEGSDSDLSIDREQPQAQAAAGDPTGAANAFAIDGRIAYGEMQKFWKPVRDVTHYVAGAALGMLEQRGISVEGDSDASPSPSGARAFWQHRSPPLSAIVDEMLVDSNNHSAEQLLRTVGERDGRGGSDASGVAAERALLNELGVSSVGIRVHDGSGLSPDDRIPPLTLASLLAAEMHRPAGGFLLMALPRPGIEGTVRYHQLMAALGRVHAKSGHIGGVNGLAGVERTARHGLITFAFIVNDPNADADAVTLGQDGAMDALATL